MNIATFPAAVAVILLLVLPALAAGPKVSEFVGNNKHNLSSRHPRTSGYKASAASSRGEEICIFCHTPHNAVSQTPLWNRSDPTVSFGHFSSSSLVISHAAGASYNEPTGSSRLCLSCHDGVTAGGISLSDMRTTWIQMQYGDKITGDALFTAAKIRSGHHPVSFVYDPTILAVIDAKKGGQGYKLPTLTKYVKLDSQSRMQCTTCHDPHQNKSNDDQFLPPPNDSRKIAPFWVYGETGDAVSDHRAVCEDCHAFSTSPWLP